MYGPDSVEQKEAVKEVDNAILHLLKRMEEKGLHEKGKDLLVNIHEFIIMIRITS